MTDGAPFADLATSGLPESPWHGEAYACAAQNTLAFSIGFIAWRPEPLYLSARNCSVLLARRGHDQNDCQEHCDANNDTPPHVFGMAKKSLQSM